MSSRTTTISNVPMFGIICRPSQRSQPWRLGSFLGSQPNTLGITEALIPTEVTEALVSALSAPHILSGSETLLPVKSSIAWTMTAPLKSLKH